MSTVNFPDPLPSFGFRLLLIAALLPAAAMAQDRLKTMPGYERYSKMSREYADAVKSGALSVTWKDEGKAFEYQKDGKRYLFDIATLRANAIETKTTNAPAPRPAGRRGGSGQPERGRQFTSVTSPDKKFKALYRDRNLWLSEATTKSTNEFPVTTDGSEKARIKYATASWVYGEELYQKTAMWWSSNSQKLAFYRFDESAVPDFHLQMAQTKLYSISDIEAYPKVGMTNPVADLLIYDVNTKRTIKVDVRDGQSFTDASTGHYVYGVSWTSDGKELIFHRTNRRQNIMELCAADAETGKCRVIVREEWPASWTENTPTMQFLKDGRRFIWSSERNGWRNYYLYDLGGTLLATLTHHDSFEAAQIVRVDEANNVMYYMARDGDNPMKLQLHRVSLEGRNNWRLTSPKFHHTTDVAPDGRHFIDIAETHDEPPVTRLMDAEGRAVYELSRSDTTKFDKLGLKKVELLQFKAGDGATDLYGLLHFPSNFDPKKKYPLLVSVYAGPATTGARETFVTPSSMTEYGFLVASFDSRSASGRGKRFLDSIYMKLGRPEMDDQAAGVKSLWSRKYLDKKRVGIYGTSYGGTASALCLMRFPDVFQAASASSAVTDFRNYDTIYTERYMWLPEENKAGYDGVNLMSFADKLKGRLMLFYGTADNNVHPNNTMQLIKALQRAGKSFEVQVGPDEGHAGLGRERMMEFFIENLVLK